jgi:hypothetical protein
MEILYAQCHAVVLFPILLFKQFDHFFNLFIVPMLDFLNTASQFHRMIRIRLSNRIAES